MKLEDLKRENEEIENGLQENAEETELVEEELEAELETDEVAEEGEEVLEPWQVTDDEDQTSDKVPVATHIKVREKLKGKLSERDEEIERLRLENETLKRGGQSKEAKLPDIPKEGDFDTYEDYQRAYTAYNVQAARVAIEQDNHQKEAQQLQANTLKQLDDAEGEHFVRASNLIEKSGIKPDVYKQSDLNVRQAIDAVMPQRGDLVMKQLINTIGDDSEKVMYYIGNNKTALAKFQGLLASDPSGFKAVAYLAEQKGKFNPKKRTTRAPAPAASLKGDAKVSASETALLKKYKAAHKKNDPQASFNIKRQAKLAGVDTSKW